MNRIIGGCAGTLAGCPEPETVPGDRVMDDPVGTSERDKLIGLVVAFGILFVIASRWM